MVLNGLATPISAPTILQQPASLNVTEGTPAQVEVTAIGSGPLGYQWRKVGTAISGATSASYRIAVTQLSQGGRYSVLVSNSQGWELSHGAVLTVLRASLPPVDPPAPLPLLVSIRWSNGAPEVRVTGTPGLLVTIQRRDSCAAPETEAWTSVMDAILPTNGPVSWSDTTAVHQPKRFYRARTSGP